MRTFWRTPRGAWLCAFALAMAIVWARPGPPLLRGADAAVYAQVAAERAAQPLSRWPDLTLAGEPFYEHPPGLMLLHAGIFSVWGATAQTTVTLAHVWASAVVLLIAAIAYELAGLTAATGAILGLCLQSGFYAESQNAMLELPLNVGLLMGLYALLVLARPGPQRPGVWTAAVLGPVWALWVKGPVALVWLPLAITAVVCAKVPRRRACLVGMAACTVAFGSVALGEWLRFRQHLPPFVPHYVRHQLWPSMVQGRHNPVASPWYYVPILMRWYAPGLMGLAGAWLTARRSTHAGARALTVLATVWLVTVVVGFSLMRQKYQWYMHTAMPAFAMGTGALAAMGPFGQGRWRRTSQRLALTAALALVGSTCLMPWSWIRAPTVLMALQTLPATPFSQDMPLRRFAVCMGGWGWRERWVARFVQHASLVEDRDDVEACLTPSGWRFHLRCPPCPD